MQTNDSSRKNLSGPADIIASLPGILGFYPQESIVLLGLYGHDDPSCVTLGPVLRADLCYADEICRSLDDVPLHDCVAVYAVVVSRIPNSDLVGGAVEALFHATGAGGEPLVDVCWHVSEVATGTPYSIVFGPAPGTSDVPGCGDQWLSGTVSSVMASPAMHALHRNNALPELHREDTFRFFDPVRRGEAEEVDDRESMTRLAMERGLELSGRLDAGDLGARKAVEEACRLLSAGPQRPIVQPWGEGEIAELLGEDDDRMAIATMLARSALRDRLLAHCLVSPLPAAHKLLSVARTFSATVRANALSAWAVVALDRGLTSWALAALATAQVEVPGHSLSEMLIALVHAGKQDMLVDVVRDGSLAAWSDSAGSL